MGYPIIIVPFMRVDGMAIYPFILLRKAGFKADGVLLQHEAIHLRQQVELLVLPFYLAYLINYLLNRLMYGHAEAYRRIIFEREAYLEERTPEYLTTRRFWAWLAY